MGINMENAFDISVIVPIYNVEEYLEECLDSLNNQTKDNIEVLLIDDGSTDSSGEIAQEYAKIHDGFFYHRKENGGLGNTRNYGVKIARGKYITFIDSDDIIDADLYEKMFIRAEKNNSEITICNVLRFDSGKYWKSGLHSIIFREIEDNTNISKSPILINDTISCNKLVLRSFYLENNFEFPENILYEDIVVTIPMHIRAKNVSVVESSYYYWRVRDGASKSITQNAQSLRNVTDRIKILRMLDKFFEDNNVDDKLQRAQQKKALEVDLLIFINSIKAMDEKTALTMLDMVNEYIDDAIDPSLFEELSLINQQKYAYAREKNIDKLIEIREYQNNGYFNAAVEEKDGRFIAALPDDLFTIESRDITDELKISEPKRNITEFLMEKGRIDFSTYMYTHRLNISESSQQKITAFLENEITGFLTPITITPIESKDITKRYGTAFDTHTNITSYYNYDSACFKVTVDLNSIDVNEQNIGYNRILIKYENRNANGFFRLNATRVLGTENGIVFGDNYAEVFYDPLKEVRILLSNNNCFVDSAKTEQGNVVIALENKAASLYAVNENGERADFDTADSVHFTCSFDKVNFGRLYYVYVNDGKPLLCRERSTVIDDKNDTSIVFMANVNHCVRFNLMNSVTFLKNMKKNGNTVKMETSHSNADGKLSGVKLARLYVNDEISGVRTVLARADVRNNGKELLCSFSVSLASRAVNKNLYASVRDMYVSYENENGIVLADLIYSEKFFKSDVTLETAMFSCYRAFEGNIILRCSRLWKKDENTIQKRKSLTAENYPKYRQEPINPRQIVFESMWGNKYSCNPQYLYEYIDKHYPEYECIWSLNDERIPIKGRGIRVRRGSQEYYHYLATAKYFINNVNFETEYVKRDGQIEIQTMHGTPLKTLGYDVKDELNSKILQEDFARKINRWNYLVVQGRFMEEKSKPIYHYDKAILRTGYPRTDVLFDRGKDKIDSIKAKINLPLDKKIILYTPTWRVRNKFDMQLDLEKMREKLGDDYIILIRIHYFASSGYTIPADNKFIYDFNAYRSVEDLYLISDILITDYSSVMFDYALLDKPMLFFTYDLENYRDNLRGIYVDIENEAPGPLLFNTDEVISAIENIDTQMEECKDKIAAFKEKYLNYENGNSCKEIVDAVIRPSKAVHYSTILKRKLKSAVRKLKSK